MTDPARSRSLRVCALLAISLTVLTAGVTFHYMGEEPFPILELPTQAEEAYELMRLVYAFTYYGLGSIAVLGWAGLALLLHHTLAAHRPATARLLVLASLLAMYVASWAPVAYYEHVPQWQQRGELRAVR